MPQTQERETVTIQAGGKSFTINAPQGLSDGDIIRKALRADKEFASLAKTNEKLAGFASEEQAHAEMPLRIKKLIPGTGTVDPTGGFAEAQRSPKYNAYMSESGKFIAETAGGMAGSALIRPVAGL